MLVKFTEEDRVNFINKSKDQNDIIQKEEKNVIESKELISEVSRIRLSQEDLDFIEKILNKKEKSSIQEEVETQEEEISEEYVETQEEEIDPEKELDESHFKEEDIREVLVTTENSDLTVESEEKKKNNI